MTKYVLFEDKVWTPYRLGRALLDDIELVRDKNELTPFDRACAMIRAGAALEVKDFANQKTALSSAAYHGHAEIVDCLIAHNADLEAKDEIELTPLAHAVFGGDVRIVQKLIAAGADVDGCRTLCLAIANAKSPMIVRALLDAEADINAFWDGEPVLELARKMTKIHPEYVTVVKMLEDEPERRWQKIEKVFMEGVLVSSLPPVPRLILKPSASAVSGKRRLKL